MHFLLSYLLLFIFNKSGFRIRIFFQRFRNQNPYTDPVSFAADPDAQIRGALSLSQGFNSAPTCKLLVGFGRAARTRLFKLVDKQNEALHASPPYSHL